MPPIPLCLFASTPDIVPLGFMVKVLTGTPEEVAGRAVEWGYDGIEFMPDPERVPDPVTFEAALRAAGASMPIVNSGRIFAQKLALLHPAPEIRRRALCGFKAMLDFGGHFHARVHLGIARGGAMPGVSRAEIDRMAEELFRDVTAHAERVGATILLEPAEGETAYIQTMAEVAAWVDRIQSPAFRAMLDTHQLVRVETSIEAGIRAARGKTEHIHLYDPSRRPPGLGTGEGTLDWPRIADVLRGEGFRGSGSVVMAAEGDAEGGARASAAYLRRVFGP